MRSQFQIPRNAVPVDGGVGIPVLLALAAVAQVSGDFVLEQTAGAIGFVQSVYIDNSGNADALTLTFPGTGQNITVKGHTQGYYPIIPCTGSFSWVAQSAGAVNVPVIFMNEKFEAAQWATV